MNENRIMKKCLYILLPIFLILINCSSENNTISNIAENLDTISENVVLKNNNIKRVLILNSFHEGYHWTDRIMNGIKSTFSGNEKVELFINYLDTKRSSDSAHFELLKSLLSNKYKKIKFDAILSTDDHALNFLLNSRDTLFPEVPVVFCGINDYEPNRIKNHNFFTGVYETYDVKGTVELILSLHPYTNKIVIISDATLSGEEFKGRVERAETSFEGILSFEYLTNLSPDLLSSKLGNIDKETAVIWSIYLRKPDGVSISCEESVRFITESTKQPVYCVWDVVGQGVVGGKITDPTYQGERAAEIILDIFDGLKVTDIPVEGSPTIYKFDYNALQKFNISESKLPEESLIINKPFSFYQTYKLAIFSIISIIILLVIIVLILLRLNRIQRNAKLQISKKNTALNKNSILLYENNINLLNAKEKAEESEKQLKLISDSFVNGVIYQVAMLDDNSRKFNYVSDTVNKLYGCTVEEVLENSDLIYGNFHPEDVNELIQKEKEALINMSIFETECRVINPDGSIRWSYFVSQPRIINNIVCWDGIEIDITERKEMEIALKLAKERAEESDRLKSAFLANMSHEIRTPMNGILGFAELLKTPNISGERLRKYIRVIEKSGKRMLNIINDIISISKIESGLAEVNMTEININEQIEYIYTFFKPEAEAKGIALSFENSLPSKEAIVKTDNEKFIAILTNLVKNAIKYSEKGSIEIGYILKSERLQFYVKDTGIGIDKDRIAAIFERFIQADISDKRALQGAGLGLSISKAYVEMLGGKLWVESEKGKGSTFYFTLPYDVETKGKNVGIIDKIDMEFETPLKKLNILIIDDDEVSSFLLEDMLENLSEKVLSAENGLEAVEISRNNPDIDLILMDIQMPVMDGYEATRQIRMFNKEVIIIAQTAFALEGDREKAIEAGCNDYLSKPIGKNKLLSLIKEHFDN